MALETNADCRLRLVQAGRAVSITGTLALISTDGADVVCTSSPALGAFALLTVGGSTEEIETRIARCVPHGADGYRVSVKLTGGTWPYSLFTRLASLNLDRPGADSTAPPCLRDLGLSLPASVEQVEEAFARRVRKAHPDRGGDVDGFVRLRQAYLEALRLLGGSR